MKAAAVLVALVTSACVAAEPPVTDCRFTTGTITIDGAANEPAWQDAREVEMMLPVTHEKPATRARGKLLWDDENLYVYIVAEDRDLRGVVTEDDKIVFTDDCLEVFVRPNPATEVYFNFEISLRGAVYDEAHGDPRWKKSQWDCEGLKKAIQTYGTVNDSTDVDKGWTLELAIPFACLLDKDSPAPGDEWTFHLSRYDYDDRYEGGKQLSSTAPLSKVSYHYYQDWTPLKFVKAGN